MPSTVEALFVIILLVAPGFLAWQVLSARIPSVFRSNTHFFVVSIQLSILVHLLVFPLTYLWAERIVELWQIFNKVSSTGNVEFDWLVFFWLILVLFIGPILLAYLLSSVWRSDWSQTLLGKIGLSRVDLTPHAWDWFFLTEENGCWIVAELNDGSKVGGEFGTNSFVSIAPHGRDIFLEKLYEITEDGKFGDELNDSIGGWISGDSIKSLGFYRVETNAEN